MLILVWILEICFYQYAVATLSRNTCASMLELHCCLASHFCVSIRDVDAFCMRITVLNTPGGRIGKVVASHAAVAHSVRVPLRLY